MIKYANAVEGKTRLIVVEDTGDYYTDVEEYFSDIENWIEEDETIEQVLRRIPSYVYGTDKVIPKINANFIVDMLVENAELREDYDDVYMIAKLQQMLNKWSEEVAEVYGIDYNYKIDISDEIDEYLKRGK